MFFKELDISLLLLLNQHFILFHLLNSLFEFIKSKDKKIELFSLTVILLLRECINKYRNIELEDKLEIIGEKNNVKLANFTEVCEGEQIPEILNEFITEFLPSFKFFGLNFLNNCSEIKSLIQHFCFWLYENNYTSSKLIINKNKK